MGGWPFCQMVRRLFRFLDSPATRRVKEHLAAMDRDRPKSSPSTSIPRGVSIKQWRERWQAVEAERANRFLAGVQIAQKWRLPEQEALAAIAGSRGETLEIRLCAVDLIGACHLVQYANLLMAMLEDNQTDSSLRSFAANILGCLGSREALPALYDVVISVRETYGNRGIFESSVMAMFSILSRYRLIDAGKYKTNVLNHQALMWWADAKPAEDMVAAWSSGEK